MFLYLRFICDYHINQLIYNEEKSKVLENSEGTEKSDDIEKSEGNEGTASEWEKVISALKDRINNS